MNSNESINTTHMHRIGIITVPNQNLYKEDYTSFVQDFSSPTHAFFNLMLQSSKANRNDCILNMDYDDNLIIARFENDAIILLSEHPILSPEQFMHLILHLQKCITIINKYLSNNNPSHYSAFALPNLNINFANFELVTDMPDSLIKQYIANNNKGQTDSIADFIYDKDKSTISIKTSSLYGVDFCTFLEQIIKLNPDIRLLMSNVVCSKKPIQQSSFIRYQEALHERAIHNESYDVFLPLQFVLNSYGDFNTLNKDFYLEWYGNPDTSYTSINYALNLMLDSSQEKGTPNICTPRTFPEVKAYMSTLNSKVNRANFIYADIEASKRIAEDTKSI